MKAVGEEGVVELADGEDMVACGSVDTSAVGGERLKVGEKSVLCVKGAGPLVSRH